MGNLANSNRREGRKQFNEFVAWDQLDSPKINYQEGGEDGEEGAEAEDDGVADPLVEHGLPFEEAALPHALPRGRHRVVLG